jgi:hypothetical protein
MQSRRQLMQVKNFRLRYNAGMGKDSKAIVQQLATRLLKQQQKLCTAESCTGGLIAKTLTDLAGSSDWFERGFVTYSNQAKNEMLAVPASVIEDYGIVMPISRSQLQALPVPLAVARKNRSARSG